MKVCVFHNLESLIDFFNSCFQTQTYITKTKEASVIAEVIVPSESKCVQVDSLPSAVKSPSPKSPSPQVNQSAPLSPDLPPQHPSSSYKLEFQVPSHLLQTPLDTGTRFVHTFATPDEIVKAELKDMKMNKILHSMEVQESDKAADLSKNRKIDNFLGLAEDKESRKASLPHDEQVNQTLSKTGRSDTKEIERSNYSSQELVSKQLNTVQFVSSVPKEISKNDDTMTIDKLYEEFYNGKISLEDFNQICISILEEEVREDPFPVVNEKSIWALEQEVSEVAQSISESQHLVSRVRQLMENIDQSETNRLKMQSYRSHDKLSDNSSLRPPKDVNEASDLRDNTQWKEVLSVCRKQGNLDMMVKFLEAVDFENITSAMVDEIIESEKNVQSKKINQYSGCIEANDSLSIHEKRVCNRMVVGNKELPSMGGNDTFNNNSGNCQHSAQTEACSAAGSELTRTEEWPKSSLSSTELSELHLDLANIRLVDVYF